MFEHDRVLNGFLDSRAPGKRRVAGHQHAGEVKRIGFLELLHNHAPCVRFVVLFDFPGGEQARARHRSVEIISVRCSERG